MHFSFCRTVPLFFTSHCCFLVKLNKHFLSWCWGKWRGGLGGLAWSIGAVILLAWPVTLNIFCAHYKWLYAFRCDMKSKQFWPQNIESRLKVSLPSDLGVALTDGVVLCHLANHVRPRSVPSIHVPSPAVVSNAAYVWVYYSLIFSRVFLKNFSFPFSAQTDDG